MKSQMIALAANSMPTLRSHSEPSSGMGIAYGCNLLKTKNLRFRNCDKSMTLVDNNSLPLPRLVNAMGVSERLAGTRKKVPNFGD